MKRVSGQHKMQRCERFSLYERFSLSELKLNCLYSNHPNIFLSKQDQIRIINFGHQKIQFWPIFRRNMAQ